MEKKDLGGLLKGKLQGAADTVKNTVKDAKIPEVRIPDIKKPDIKMPDIKVPDQVKNVFKKSENETKEATAEEMEGAAKKEAEIMEAELSKSEIQIVKAVSPVNAVKIFYYLMAADGNIGNSEIERFELVGKELDQDFSEHKEHIEKVCKEQLDKVIDKDDYYDVVQDGVEEALLSKQESDKGFVPAKLLVWDLLTIAYSDEEYGEEERKLMKYIVRKVDIPKDVFLEMESSYLSVTDIQKELDWIKSTDRPYLEIDKQVKELERRQNAIYESVKALIYL